MITPSSGLQREVRNLGRPMQERKYVPLSERLSWTSSVFSCSESSLTAHQEDGPPSCLRLRSVARICTRATELRLREDGYETAPTVPFQGAPSRTIALRMVSSLRATAMRATFFGLPAATRRS